MHDIDDTKTFVSADYPARKLTFIIPSHSSYIF